MNNIANILLNIEKYLNTRNSKQLYCIVNTLMILLI